MTAAVVAPGLDVRRSLLGYPTRQKVSDAVVIRRKGWTSVIASMSMHAISESRENPGFPDAQNPETKFGARSAPNLRKFGSGRAKFGAVGSSGTTGDDANLGPRCPESQAASG